MSSFRFEGQHLDDKLVASISLLLSAAGIPSVLWGNYLLAIYGVPTIVDVNITPIMLCYWLYLIF